MNCFKFISALFCFSVFSYGITIDELIDENVGSHFGKQEKDARRCRFDVSEMGANDFLMTATFQSPGRGRSVRYPAGAKKFTLNAPAGTLVFDKSDFGKPNLIYHFNVQTLKMVAVEEKGWDICRF